VNNPKLKIIEMQKRLGFIEGEGGAEGGEAKGEGEGKGDSDTTASGKLESSAATGDTSQEPVKSEQSRRHSMIVGRSVLPPSFADKVISVAAKLKVDAQNTAPKPQGTTSEKTEGPASGDSSNTTGERKGSVILHHPTKERPMGGSKRLPSSASRRGSRPGSISDTTTVEESGSSAEVSEIEKVLSKRVVELEEKLEQRKEEITALAKERDDLKQKLEEKEVELQNKRINVQESSEGKPVSSVAEGVGAGAVGEGELVKLKEEVEVLKKERDEVKTTLAEKEKEVTERGEEINRLNEAKDKLEQMLKQVEDRKQQEEDEWKKKLTAAETVEKGLKSEMERKEKEWNEERNKGISSTNEEVSKLTKLEQELKLSQGKVEELEGAVKQREQNSLQKETELNNRIQELSEKEKNDFRRNRKIETRSGTT